MAKPALERVAFSPGEFAALFGKQQTWGYRQIYAGKVKAITEYGRIQIPAAEVERILSSAGIYEGMPKKAAKTKAELQAMKPAIQSAWRKLVEQRRMGKRITTPKAGATPLPHSDKRRPDARKAAFERLTSKKNKAPRRSD